MSDPQENRVAAAEATAVQRARAVSHAPAPFDRLSPRELEVVTCIANGFSNDEIALQVGCSKKTVDTHRANALKKLGLRHNVDLTREAIQAGLVTLDGVVTGVVYDAHKGAWRKPVPDDETRETGRIGIGSEW